MIDCVRFGNFNSQFRWISCFCLVLPPTTHPQPPPPVQAVRASGRPPVNDLAVLSLAVRLSCRPPLTGCRPRPRPSSAIPVKVMWRHGYSLPPTSVAHSSATIGTVVPGHYAICTIKEQTMYLSKQFTLTSFRKKNYSYTKIDLA